MSHDLGTRFRVRESRVSIRVRIRIKIRVRVGFRIRVWLALE
jgi:hypothetical protein